MTNIFTDLTPDLSTYLDENQLIQLSLTSTFSLFNGLNNLKFKRYVPSLNEHYQFNSLDLLENGEIKDKRELLREIKKLKDINMKDESGLSAFHLAVALEDIDENIDVLELLLKMGADVDSNDFEGNTPLLGYINMGNAELNVLELLLKAGANINTQNSIGETPILAYIESTRITFGNINLDVINLFLNNGADISIRNNIGETPLHLATEIGEIADIDFLKLIVDSKVDISLQNSNDETAVHIALEDSNINILEYILANYTIPELLELDWDSVKDVAKRNDNLDILKILLLKYSIPVNLDEER